MYFWQNICIYEINFVILQTKVGVWNADYCAMKCRLFSLGI